MLRVLITGLLLVAGAQIVNAQQAGTVTIIKDPMIDSLIKRRIELSKAANPPGVALSTEGYRVQIFSGLDREKVYAEQTRFKTLYPNVPTYISYVQPNYRLRVGDFRTRLEAQKFQNELRRRYSSLFIFEEKINLR